MTELIYLTDCYAKEFSARVIGQGDGYVVLDKTAFYPEGGGQPTDTGTLNSVRVTKVKKENGEVRHYTESAVTGEAHGVLDWEKRYAHMRYHTAQHLLSAIMLDEYGAETCGNQLHSNRARIDFTMSPINEEARELATKKFNEIVGQALPVKLFFTTREGMLEMVGEKRRKLFGRIPESVKNVRIVEIKGVDKCPCAGTHVANTKEIGKIKITGVSSKGSGKTRISFELE